VRTVGAGAMGEGVRDGDVDVDVGEERRLWRAVTKGGWEEEDERLELEDEEEDDEGEFKYGV